MPKKKPFNNPFERLKLKKDEPAAPKSPATEALAAKDAGRETFPTEPQARRPVRQGALTEDELWALAV